MKKLIDIQKKVVQVLEDEGKKENLKVKNYIEKIIVEKYNEIISKATQNIS